MSGQQQILCTFNRYLIKRQGIIHQFKYAIQKKTFSSLFYPMFDRYPKRFCALGHFKIRQIIAKKYDLIMLTQNLAINIPVILLFLTIRGLSIVWLRVFSLQYVCACDPPILIHYQLQEENTMWTVSVS